MKKLATLKKALARCVSASKLTDVVQRLIKDNRFNEALDDMISASKTAILVAQKNKNDEMRTFNSLCLNFFEAIKNKDENTAQEAAQALVQAGHGKAFGLE
jgi:hypothetical protein